MENSPEDRVGYEPALRVIGRQLDAEPAYHVSILEVVDGFAVRSHPAAHRSDGRTVHYSWDRLRDLVTYQIAGRGVPRRRSRHSGMWGNFPNGHEDFFRALGHELDEQHASSLTVDEIAEGVTVSYIRPESSGSLNYEKHHALMKREDIEVLLRVAQSRRSRAAAGSAGT